MEKLANRSLVVALGCFVAAIACLIGAWFHLPTGTLAQLLVATAGFAGATMVWALAQLSPEGAK